MEPAGLAVGLIGLAGMFSSCLEVVERFDYWRNFGNDSRSLSARLEAEQVRDHLSIIETLCQYAADASLPVVGTGAGTIKQGFPTADQTQPHPDTSSESRRRKVRWALRDKAKCTAQVENLGLLVQDLHNLVPPHEENGVRVEPGGADVVPRHKNDVLTGRETWTVEFRKILGRIETEMMAETKRDLHLWLLGSHVLSEVYDNAVRKRLGGTCDWILTRRSFLDWVSFDFPAGSPKLLWVNGPAGFGKTVLCGRVVEYCSSTLDAPTARFFFSSDFESRRDPFVAMRSWLSQLISHPVAFDLIREGWESQHGNVATQADLVRLFREIVCAIPGCTFIMDGLDECPGAGDDEHVDGGSSVAEFLETVQRAVFGTATRIMVASRDEPEIRHGIVRSRDLTPFECSITSADVESDIKSYSRSIVEKRLPNKDAVTRDEVARKLASRCNGQFLWLKLQEPSLRSGKNKKQLGAAIDRTPTGLERLYDRNWERMLALPGEEKARAFSLLRWVAFAVRPLTVSEVVEALLLDDNDFDDILPDEIPDTIDDDFIDSEILGICGSLLEVRPAPSESSIGMRTVHLAHFSVKEYFIYRMSDKSGEVSVLKANTRLQTLSEAAHNAMLAKMCLRYMNSRSFWQETPCGDTDRGLGAFGDYAAVSWYHHAAVSDPAHTEVVRLTNELFGANDEPWHAWRKRFDAREEEGVDPTAVTTPSPLYYASKLCLAETVKFLLRDKKYSPRDEPSGISALTASCRCGSVEVARLLLDEGADVMALGKDGWKALHKASIHGHHDLVQLLLERGADTAAVKGWTPLALASYHGHAGAAKLLLEAGADMTAKVDEIWTPMNVACYLGHTEVVRLLLEQGGRRQFQGRRRIGAAGPAIQTWTHGDSPATFRGRR